MMKKLFWNVQIELCKDGTVRAAVIRTRKAIAIPRDAYVHNPGQEAWSIWFPGKKEADEAVIEARAMSSATSEEAFDKILAKEPEAAA
jgi:hypothetical protein